MMSKSCNKKLSIDTKAQVVNSSESFGIPLLASSSSSTSTVTAEPSSSLTTPTNQPTSTMAPEKREAMAKDLIYNLGLNWDELQQKAQIRAKKIMSEDFSWSPNSKKENSDKRTATTFCAEFNKFLSSLEEQGVNVKAWRDHSAVFFGAEAMDRYLVIRKQKSGICCLHASVVLQHYLNYIRNVKEGCNHKMLDISKFLRENLEREKQIQYIQEGTCGLGSEAFFRTITGLPDFALARIQICKKSMSPGGYYSDINSFFFYYDELKEPALVSCFNIEDEFVKGGVFDGEIDRERFHRYAEEQGEGQGSLRKHSMVMLGGYRDDDTGKVWFLLQNFWQDRYFSIVSAEYLASCEATIIFVKKEFDVSLKNTFSTVEGVYAETSIELEECAPPSPQEC